MRSRSRNFVQSRNIIHLLCNQHRRISLNQPIMSYIILIPAVLHLYRLLLSCIWQLYWWQRLFWFNLLLWHPASGLQLLDSWRFRLKWPQLIYLKWLIFMLIPKFAFYCSSLFFNNLPCSECEEESKSREIYLITLQPPAAFDVGSVPKIDCGIHLYAKESIFCTIPKWDWCTHPLGVPASWYICGEL